MKMVSGFGFRRDENGWCNAPVAICHSWVSCLTNPATVQVSGSCPSPCALGRLQPVERVQCLGVKTLLKLRAGSAYGQNMESENCSLEIFANREGKKAYFNHDMHVVYSEVIPLNSTC
jgi:hypothetical protein